MSRDIGNKAKRGYGHQKQAKWTPRCSACEGTGKIRSRAGWDTCQACSPEPEPEHTQICIGRGGTPGPDELCPACAEGIERILERWYP